LKGLGGAPGPAPQAASQLRAARVGRSRGCPGACVTGCVTAARRSSWKVSGGPRGLRYRLRHGCAPLKLEGLGGAPGPASQAASQLRAAQVGRSRGCPGACVTGCVTAARR